MKRVFNFSPGPAMLPEPVLKRAQAELLDWRGSGMSVMEVSHRGSDFIELAAQSEKNLRELLGVPANYKVLFLQGGATLQFAAVPLNLAQPGAVVDYVVTGNWGEKAVQEAERYAKVNVAATGKATKFTAIPDPKTWRVSDSAAYLHYTPNETVFGVEFHYVPEVSDAPLVVDMSSTLLSRPIDVSRFGLIYAGAQKNIGPAGLALVIVRDDLIGHAASATPAIFDYKVQAEADSMHNTPPSYAIYLAGLVFQWLKKLGGLKKMEELNIAKAKLLYDYLDQTEFYHSPVAKEDRSRMNIPFTLRNDKLDAEFLKQAQARGLAELKGHRSVGGMRASIYNAMPVEGVKSLVEFMRDFEKRNG